jgi:hypothetical protein
MKRAFIAAFILLYATLTVLAIAQHTASWASAFTADSRSQTAQMKANAPHSSQVRIEEDPFVVFRTLTVFALADAGSSGLRAVSRCFVFDSTRSVPSRAPPTLL